MRKLTMPGFLAKYVRELAEAETLNVHKLYNNVQKGNYRLKEPLFLYCYYSNKSDVLTKYLDDADKAEFDGVKNALESGSSPLLPNYEKVFKAYEFQNGKHDNEVRVKKLMANKITRLQAEKKISSYRVYTDLHINSGNYDSFIKGRNYNKLSLDKSREVMEYLERL